MIIGVVLTALGLKKVLEYVSDTEHHHLDDPLKLLAALALLAGVGLYFFAQAAFTYRMTKQLGIARVVVGAVSLALIPIATLLPAMALLALVTVMAVGLVCFEGRTVNATAQ